MISGVSEIEGTLKTACAEGRGLDSQVKKGRASALRLTERAQEHGWAGVSLVMQDAVEALGAVNERLAEFQRSGVVAASQLDLIDDQGSADHVSLYLTAAEKEIEYAIQELDAATVLLETAIDACIKVGQKGLPNFLASVRESLLKTRGQVEKLPADCAVVRRVVEAWVEETPDEEAPSSDSPASTIDILSGQAAAPAAPVTMSRPPPQPQQAADDASTPTAFDKLVDPTGKKRAPEATAEPSVAFFTLDELKRTIADEPVPPTYSRATKRLRAGGGLALIAAEGSIGAFANLGSDARQVFVGLFFGTIATMFGVPNFRKVLRETEPKHKSRLTARERRSVED